MLKIAIVGSIASGKSTLEKIISDLGYPVFDTDKIAHSILEKSSEVIRVFGTNDRKELAKVVFANKEKMQELESIIHPEVKKEILKIFELDLDVAFISVPQLFEAGFETLFDKIIYITANKNIRKERLIARNSYTPEEAQVRIDSQKEGGKILKSDFVIENNSDLSTLENKIKNIISILLG